MITNPHFLPTYLQLPNVDNPRTSISQHRTNETKAKLAFPFWNFSHKTRRYAQAFKRLKTIYDEPASFLIQLSNAAFPFELSRDRSVETFEAILNYPSSSPSIISSRISWRISSSFFSFPSPLLFFSVAHRWKLFRIDGRFHRENENKSKLKSKLAGVNCNSISFQLEKRVEAPRTSMELQRGNEGEVARCKTIKRVLLFFFQKTNVVYLFSTSTRGRERERVCVCVCVSSGAALEQRLYTSQSREYALHRMAGGCYLCPG